MSKPAPLCLSRWRYRRSGTAAKLPCDFAPLSGRRRRQMWSAYPSWLNSGDNAWQLTAATLVGLMSVPGLVVLYGGVMQKRWSVNSMMMSFIAFALVLIVWVGYGYKLGFGTPVHVFGADHGFFANVVGHPGSVLSSDALR